MITIRHFSTDDFPDYYFIRREALRQNPEAFHTKLADFDAQPPEKEFRRFEISMRDPERFILGAFAAGGEVVGMSGFGRHKMPDFRNAGFIWGVFVSKKARGQGLGRRLLVNAIELAGHLPEVETVRLSVMHTNLPAIRLYEKVGFEVFDPELSDPILGGECSSEVHMRIRVPTRS